MPELPEVETIRRQLERAVLGAKITEVVVRFAGRLNLAGSEFIKNIAGKKIISVGRRAKLLLINLTGDTTIVAHLKMTGSFLLRNNDRQATKHTHIIFKLKIDGRNQQLFFEDMRKFGYLRIYKTSELEEKVFSKYGPEPLEPKFDLATFTRCMRGPGPKRVKPKLLDQSCLAGVGNIYADEACFVAKIKPSRRIDAINPTEYRNLYQGVRKNLLEAIKKRGTSTEHYVDLYGQEGEYVPKLNVYDRAGLKCRRCSGTIKKIRLAGRGTHFCPRCQK